jgi:microcompartment protein CcmK/EutM
MTCILSREVRGRKETVALAVSYDEEPSTLSLETVAATINKKTLKGKYLLVPQAADVSAAPKEIKVISMNSFGFVDGNLVWLTKKKNARHYPQPEVPVRAGAATSTPAPHAA